MMFTPPPLPITAAIRIPIGMRLAEGDKERLIQSLKQTAKSHVNGTKHVMSEGMQMTMKQIHLNISARTSELSVLISDSAFCKIIAEIRSAGPLFDQLFGIIKAFSSSEMRKALLEDKARTMFLTEFCREIWCSVMIVMLRTLYTYPAGLPTMSTHDTSHTPLELPLTQAKDQITSRLLLLKTILVRIRKANASDDVTLKSPSSAPLDSKAQISSISEEESRIKIWISDEVDKIVPAFEVEGAAEATVTASIEIDVTPADKKNDLKGPLTSTELGSTSPSKKRRTAESFFDEPRSLTTKIRSSANALSGIANFITPGSLPAITTSAIISLALNCSPSTPAAISVDQAEVTTKPSAFVPGATPGSSMSEGFGPSSKVPQPTEADPVSELFAEIERQSIATSIIHRCAKTMKEKHEAEIKELSARIDSLLMESKELRGGTEKARKEPEVADD